jgi:hypothetical protein
LLLGLNPFISSTSSAANTHAKNNRTRFPRLQAFIQERNQGLSISPSAFRSGSNTLIGVATELTGLKLWVFKNHAAELPQITADEFTHRCSSKPGYIPGCAQAF